MSSDHPSPCFIVNPQSAGGRTKKQWPAIAQQVTAAFGEVAVRFTRGPGDAIAQTTAAIEEGHKLLVSVGGDGTNNEVINGMFAPDGTPRGSDLEFAFYPSGSGGDLRRTIHTAEDVTGLIAMLRGGNKRQVDLGRISFIDMQGEEATRFFINIASFGVSAVVNRKVSESSKPLGGPIAFYTATVSAMLTFNNPLIEFSCDDGPKESAVSHVVAVANGCYFGGGMKMAPDARMDDGMFEIVAIGDMKPFELVTSSASLYKGTHIHNKKNWTRRAKKFVATSPEEVFLDVDGEGPGRLPATFEVLPKHVTVRAL